MSELAWPWMLLLVPLPLLAWWLLRERDGVGIPALRLPGRGVDAMAPPGARRGRAWPPLLLFAAWLLLCVAAARPQAAGPAVQTPQQARELMLAVDLSGSMAEADMRLDGRPVDRLVAVKAVLADFLERREGDRIGLVVFGTRAFTLTPLTHDLQTLREQLAGMDIAMAGRETAIGDAIALSVRRHGVRAGRDREEGAPPRAVVLLTDGVNNAGAIEPDRAAATAAALGVRVHTIGFGSERGPASMFGMVLPRSQAEIDEDALRAISRVTGGRYFRAQDTDALAGIYAELDRIEAREQRSPPLQPRIERFTWPLAGALLLLLVAQVPRPERGSGGGGG